MHSRVLRSVFRVGWHEMPLESRSGPWPMFSLCPWPNCPKLFWPQHFRTPLSSIAQVKVAPASIDIAVLPVPRSAATRSSPISLAPSPLVDWFPIPSWPALLSPQHLTLPSSSRAHEWCWPVAISVAVLLVPRSTAARKSPISLGPSPIWVVLPIPSWP